MTKRNPRLTTGVLRSGPGAAEQDHRTPEARIGALITPTPSGCWLFKDDPGAYGQLAAYGKSQSAHRFVYEIMVGRIPRGHQLHHTCETPACVNPAHLEPLTPPAHRRRHNHRRPPMSDTPVDPVPADPEPEPDEGEQGEPA